MFKRKILCLKSPILLILYQIVAFVNADIGENDLPSCYVKLSGQNYGIEDFVVELNGIWSRIYDINNESISEDNLSLMAIITCNYNVNHPICKQNEAILKDVSDNYYYIAENKNFKNTLLTTDNTSCYNNVGNLINISGEIHLCLNENIALPFNSSGDYLLNTTVNEENPFSQLYSQYILIRTTNNMFIKDSIHDDSNKYVFVNSQSYMATEIFESGIYINDYFKCNMFGCSVFAKIHDQTRIVTYNDNGVIRGIPYKLNEEDDLVKIVEIFDTGIYAFNFKDHDTVGMVINDNEFNESLSYDDLSHTLLFYCTYAKCTSTEGYIKYITNEGTIAVNYCNENYCTIQQYYNTECTEDLTAFYNYNDDKFIFCTKNAENLYELIPITINNNNGQSYNFFAPISLEVNIYYYLTTNNSGNIVGFATETGVLNINSFDENKLLAMICEKSYYGVETKNEFSVCYKDEHLNGFYKDFLKGGNNLMYCENSNCNSNVKYNGYFMNSKNDIIQCNSGLCLSISSYMNTCYSNYSVNKTENGSFSFCYNNTPYDITSNDYYYLVENIDPNTPYPYIEEGNGSIMIKVSQYSVEQYLTDQNGKI
ncbi:hypothetical protein PIROE2DRAFT_56836 [Piromyces sp. E2]|nr:hypothetical protein PIROE2DRAFT_56836 [Piromyces sp. E2]|eukprot:OUM70331.1 hypothetical protein PIROE2DRAFT_56836 [Piromyces sp. E2]